ncbi:hypothetical protein ACTQZK_06550 [Paraeggerthella sp. LCP19S3_G8]|uniref:hypothetical protein n=1 Tax=Paraeggerthella sp. LCP19S3_G8 TaxID=3440248 RepID=UPI002A886C7F|nr:hypothetical protein [Paraeggerthella sp.]
MSLLDEYIAKCDEATSDGFPQNERNALAREIISAFHNTIPNIRHYRGARITGDGSSNDHTKEDIKQLRGKLLALRDEQQREFDEKFGCSVVSGYIKKCEHLIEDSDTTDEAANELGFEISSIYFEKIDGFDNGIGRVDGYGYVVAYKKSDLPKIRGKLMEYRDEIVRSANGGTPPATVTVAQSNHQSVSVAVDLNVAMSQMWALPDSVMTSDEKMELAKLLNELEESKGEGKEKVKKAAKAVGNWLFDKAIEAVPTVMPFVAQSIQTATGA